MPSIDHFISELRATHFLYHEIKPTIYPVKENICPINNPDLGVPAGLNFGFPPDSLSGRKKWQCIMICPNFLHHLPDSVAFPAAMLLDHPVMKFFFLLSFLSTSPLAKRQRHNWNLGRLAMKRNCILHPCTQRSILVMGNRLWWWRSPYFFFSHPLMEHTGWGGLSFTRF